MRLGAPSRTVDIPEGSTVEAALAAAHVDLAGNTVTRDTQGVALTAECYDGDTILLSPKVTGGK